ncbi:MAG: hypothetical protein HQK75_10140 [Candidatus Magnetomorum sp.]|nr:hypothetical protein [Candidatus Magnetomorum sp.]
MSNSFIYKPFADVNGHDSFEFVYNDGVMDSVSAQISITIRPVDDPPFAWGGDYTFYEDTPATGFISASDADFVPDILALQNITIIKENWTDGIVLDAPLPAEDYALFLTDSSYISTSLDAGSY